MHNQGIVSLNTFLEQELLKDSRDERKNRFFDENLSKKRRSLTQELSVTQKKKYDFIAYKNIKRER